MVKKILGVLMCASFVSPVYAGERPYQYSDYSSYSGYGRAQNAREYRSERRHYHRRGNGSGTAVALIGGIILGAAIAKSTQRTETRAIYSERDFTPDCYDRKVTEQTVSGRLVTYIETVCR